ncbi:MAG: TIGR03000 domain-containing protein [Planctomycetota bacterium]
MPVESYRVISETPVVGSGEVIQTPKAAAPAATDATMLHTPIPGDAAMLVVKLPANAKIFVNGSRTAATGSVRRFVSQGLAKDKDYEYVVRMVVTRDGIASEETKVVSLTGGDRSVVSFLQQEATAELVIPGLDAVRHTSLTLHVPAQANVWLAGNKTASTGEVRLFETSNLHEGQTWKNYEIRVTTVVDGREQVASKTIDLLAGTAIELSLDPREQTASNAATAALR